MTISTIVEIIFHCGSFAILPAILFLMLRYAIKMNAKRVKAWTEAAGRLGISMTSSSSKRSLRMAGIVDGVDVEVRVETNGAGENKSWYTVALVGVSGQCEGLGRKVRVWGAK